MKQLRMLTPRGRRPADRVPAAATVALNNLQPRLLFHRGIQAGRIVVHRQQIRRRQANGLHSHRGLLKDHQRTVIDHAVIAYAVTHGTRSAMPFEPQQRPNTRGNLGGWITDTQRVKPGALMPATRMSADDLHALLDFLQSLR